MKKKDLKHISRRKSSYVVQIKRERSGTRQQVYVGSFSPKKYGSDEAAYKAALAARDEALAKMTLNAISVTSLTVQAAFDQVQERCESESTKENNSWMFENLVPESLRGKKIKDVTLDEIQRTADQFALKKSQDAVKRVKGFWCKIFVQARRTDPLIQNLGELIVIPKSKIPTKRTTKHVSEEELGKFYSALLSYNAKRPRARELNQTIYAMAKVMEHTGLRPQEAMGIKVEDIDEDLWILHVRRSIGSTKSKRRQEIPLKTEASMRDIPIIQAIREIVIKQCDRMGEGFLFLDLDGKPFDIRRLSKYVNRVSKKAKVHVTLYVFRHMMINGMIQVTDLKNVQGVAGHSNASTTLGYANKPTLERMSAAMENRKMS